MHINNANGKHCCLYMATMVARKRHSGTLYYTALLNITHAVSQSKHWAFKSYEIYTYKTGSYIPNVFPNTFFAAFLTSLVFLLIYFRQLYCCKANHSADVTLPER